MAVGFINHRKMPAASGCALKETVKGSMGNHVLGLLAIFAPPPAEASEIVHQDALAYSEFSQGVG